MLGSMASPQIRRVSTLGRLAAVLGPPSAGGAVALIGGADGLSTPDMRKLEALFARLVGYLDETATALIDGGTDSGIMRLIGRARDRRGATFRLVGVLPRGALNRSTRDGRPISIEQGHPEIILSPGDRFGDESPYLFGAADHLAGGIAPTLVVNGGQLTMREARTRLDAGLPVVVVAGTGRTADELAADPDLRGSAKLRVIPLSATVADLETSING
jgi:hypothetical protein